MIPRAPRTLTPEERWQELDLLVRNYDAIIAELGTSKEAYGRFLASLPPGYSRPWYVRSAAMQRLEEERLADAQLPEVQQDATLQRLLHEDGDASCMGCACWAGATAAPQKDRSVSGRTLGLVADQTQRQRPERVDRTSGTASAGLPAPSAHRSAVRDAARMAEVAVHFEEYMRDHLGPQGILEQVVRVDSDLHRAVAETEDLTRQLQQRPDIAAGQ